MNNIGNWGATYPNWLFGAWNATGGSYGSGDSAPKKLASIQVTVSIDPLADINAASDTKTSVFLNDSTKVWLVSDLDGRNFTGTAGGNPFGITDAMALPFTPEHLIPQRNGCGWQPVHGASWGMPSASDPHSGIGRNYGFLDGHAEFLVYDEWPGANVPGSVPN